MKKWYIVYKMRNIQTGQDSSEGIDVIDIHPFRFMELNTGKLLQCYVTYMREINDDEYWMYSQYESKVRESE